MMADENTIGFPLSPSQQRMWFLENITKNCSGYVVTLVFRIQGELNYDYLNRAYQAIIDKHDLLRSIYIEHENRIVQKIVEHVQFNVQQIKFVSEKNIDDQIMSLVEKEHLNKYDFKEAPLLSAKLVEISSTEYIFISAMHHIIVDGWSLKLILQDLSIFYNTLYDGKPIEIDKPKVSYFNYVQKCIELENNINYQKSEVSFWKKYLQDVDYTEIYPDMMRRPNLPTRGKTKYVLVNNEKTQILEKIAHENSVTLYIILLTLFAVIYTKYVGKTSFIVGSPVANRTEEDFEKIVGLFVNTIPIKIDFDKEASFTEILKSVSDSVIQAFSHKEYPFEKIVDVVCEHRTIDRNPLFQPMFSMQDNIAEKLQLKNLQINEINQDFSTTRFDIESNFWRDCSGLKWRIIYNESLYDERTIENFIKYFNKLVSEVISNPALKYSSFNLLSSNDQLELLKMGHGKKINLKDSNADTIIKYIDDAVMNYPSNYAIEFETTAVCYKDLQIYYHSFSNVLNEKLSNHRPNTVVALILRPSIEMAVAILGIMSAGLTLLPINPDDPPSRIEYILNDAGARLIITQNDLLQSVKNINIEVMLFENVNILLCNSKMKSDTHKKLNKETLAYILYTSGTTGLPKGVMVSHKNLLHTIISSQDAFNFISSDIFTSFALFSFDIFYFEFFSMLICGGKTRLVAKNDILDSSKVISILSDTTAFQAVPSLIQQFLNIFKTHEISAIEKLRRVTTGGEIVFPSLLINLREVFPKAEVSVTYGPTESTIICAKYVADSNQIYCCYIGKPLPNIEMRLYDDLFTLVPVGVPGEIYVGGDGVTQGYINQPELTQNKFIEINGKPFYKTGDIGRWRFDGNLEFLGRRDDQVKLRGYRIELDSVSAVIMQYPNVVQACSIIWEGSAKQKEIVSYVTLDKSNSDDVLCNELDEKQSQQWRKLFDDTHLEYVPPVDEICDFTGWNSIISGQPIPLHHMEQWLNGTMQSIFSNVNQKKLIAKNLKVLEVGCGTGLIIFKLYQYCSQYDASDFSASVLHSLQDKIDYLNINNINLYQCDANKIATTFTQKYDLIILNSVIQYFPSIDYFELVLSSLLNILEEDGCLFVGDIRDYRKLPMLYSKIIAGNLKTEKMSMIDKNNYIKRKLQLESELCIDPSYFLKLSTSFNNDITLHLEPRLEEVCNELSGYRYNVIFKNEQNLNRKNLVVNHFSDLKSNYMNQIRECVNSNGYMIIKDIPDMRLEEDIEIYLNMLDKEVDLGVIKPQKEYKFTPFLFLNSAELNSYTIKFDYFSEFINGFNLIVYRRDFKEKLFLSRNEISISNSRALYTQPLSAQFKKIFQSKIKEFIRKQLPEYMVPQIIEILPNLPLTSHGKIDKKLLPVPCHIVSIDKLSHGRLKGIEETLVLAISNVLNHTDFSIEDNFFDIGGTSLLAIQLAIELRKYNITIKAQTIFKYQKICELASHLSIDVTNVLKTKKSNRVPEIFWHEYIKKVYSERENINTHHINIESSVVFLIGATGYLGCHILYELVKQGSKQIYCLVRNNDGEEINRLEKRYHYYFQEALPKNVTSLIGDVSSFRLGLSHSKWLELANTCRLVINAAANVRHVGYKEEIYLSNYYGVKELINFTKAGQKKFLYHLSTIGVKGIHPDTSITFTEKDFDVGQEHTEDYSASKFLAERLILHYIAKGGNAAIFRIGTIAPHSEKAYFQHNVHEHFLTRYIKSTVECGLAGNWSQKMIALTAVDELAKAILLLITSDTKFTPIYHLMKSNEVSYLQIVLVLKECGYDIEIVDKQDFKDRIYTQQDKKLISSHLTGILQMLDNDELDHVKISCKSTIDLLHKLGFIYQTTTTSWLKKFIQHCQNIKYLPIPKNKSEIGTALIGE